MGVQDRKERELELERYRALQHETTDPMAARLLDEIVNEMEAELKADKQP